MCTDDEAEARRLLDAAGTRRDAHDRDQHPHFPGDPEHDHHGREREHAHRHVSRRGFLTAVGVGAGAAVLRPGVAAAAEQAPTTFTGSRAVQAAMHVHASWSEGSASWEQQFFRASQQDIDVMYMTDHDHRALAQGYLKSLLHIDLDTTRDGAAQDVVADHDQGSLHLRIEAAQTAAPASVTLSILEKPVAKNRLRTGIAGHRITHTFGAGRLDAGATYEMVVTLSDHPARAGRPAGPYSLRFRFGGDVHRRSKQDGGITGVVTAPLPPAGTAVEVDPLAEAARFWPDMLAVDNGFVMLSFVVTSPGAGSVADVTVASVTIARSQNTPDDVIRQQRTIIDTYSDSYPGLKVYPSVEVSDDGDFPHWNLFGVPQRMPDKRDVAESEYEAYYAALGRSVHADGGVVSWNHVFGPAGGPLLSPQAQVDIRRATFSQLYPKRLLGADVLEVGYVVRSGCGIETFLDLWDAFSRRALFLTGNGANDDHEGELWDELGNGYSTGIWAGSTGNGDLARVLAAGRAYVSHPGLWPGGQLDLLVDDTVPMGSVVVGRAASRTVSVLATALPRGSHVELLQGVVDYQGVDPKNTRVFNLPGRRFSGSGVVKRPVDTSGGSCFVRAQVRNSAGLVIGTSNPVWLLREEPPDGIPAPRRVG